MRDGEMIIGIDPGKSGAIAFVDSISNKVGFYNFDSEYDFMRRIDDLTLRTNNVKCYLEKVNAMPGQGVTSMFTFGNNYGFIRGVLMTMGIPVTLIRPQEWQKGLGGLKGLKGADRKRKLKDHAATKFPNIKITLRNADALLIMQYGINQNT